MSCYATWICQYQALQSKMVKTVASPRESMHLSILGNGYESFLVAKLRR